MNYNKKFCLVFLLLILFPVVIIFSPNILTFFRLSESLSRSLSYWMLYLAVLSSAYLIYKNNKTIKSKFWYILSIFSLIMLLGFLYTINSLSHFGF